MLHKPPSDLLPFLEGLLLSNVLNKFWTIRKYISSFLFFDITISEKSTGVRSRNLTSICNLLESLTFRMHMTTVQDEEGDKTRQDRMHVHLMKRRNNFDEKLTK